MKKFLMAISFFALAPYCNLNEMYGQNQDDAYWHLKDFASDSIVGTSFIKAVNAFPIKKNHETVVAILDTEIATEHPVLRSSIWFNSNEVKNGVDDDCNGYIDDLNGWNFLGNLKGENVLYQKHEATRLISLLEGNARITNKDSMSFEYKIYKKALKFVNSKREEAENILKYTPKLIADYRLELRNPNLPDDNSITLALLDSLIISNLINKEEVTYLYRAKALNMNLSDLIADSLKYVNRLRYIYNRNYDDRSLVGDQPYDFKDSIYGNGIVNANVRELWHGTNTAGVIVDGQVSTSFIKLMPLCISNNGNEFDKDIYLAMKYAVDQGASVINICTGKTFTINEIWFDKILKYAESKNVLIVASAGNTKRDLDLLENDYYPDDSKDGKEFVSNFIRVGASGKNLDSNLKASFSSYGKNEVDLFAPGVDILTTSSIEESGYTTTEGTSLATPLVSRIAALLFSQYPSLTAPEVKQILMDSSVKYDILVDVPTKENPEQQLPFSELSKSGGIVNAYNAMLMAEEYVKDKK